jgi:hypothetical protein
MEGNLKVFVADEAEPDVALFELDSPEMPRPGDVVGDFIAGTYRIERRVYLLDAEADGVRRAKAVHLVCKRVIV